MDFMKIMTSDEGYIGDNLKIPDELKLKGKELCWKYNQTSPASKDERIRILKELFGTCSDRTFIQPVFNCDYGFNIHTHGFALINYN